MTDRPGNPPVWSVASGTTIGSVHVRDGLPLQDAVLTWRDPAHGQAVIAVADGHGHRLHFRSDVGASLAVACAVDEVRKVLPRIAVADSEAAHELVRQAGAALVRSWTEQVRLHLSANPYSPADDDLGASLDPMRAYGSTILVAAAVGETLVFAQIGDGDTVLVTSDGTALRPLPEDPDLDGLRTTSLCQRDPLDALRVAVVDASGGRGSLVYLCSDGFGRARVDTDGWWHQTGAQLLDFARTRGIAWVREQLPDWLAEPASVGGDDTTMALLVRNDIAGVVQADLTDTVPAS